jgi:hypothetical protein
MERGLDAYIEGFSPSIDNFREVEDRDFSCVTTLRVLNANISIYKNRSSIGKGSC